MKNLVKHSLISFITVLLLFSMTLNVFAEEGTTESKTIEFVVLGDSIAAGVTSDGLLGRSYGDVIKESFEAKGVKVNLTKLAIPGYTSSQVLEQLNKEEVKYAVSNANIVTITAGANEMLQIAKIDAEKGTLEFNEEEAKEALAKVADNIKNIVKTIKTLNPNVDIYVTDYIFPFPHLKDENLIKVQIMMGQINETILLAAELSGAKAVSVHQLIGFKTNSYMPNPSNVHPNEAGYKKLAEAFFLAYGNVAPLNYTDITGHWAEKEIRTLTQLNLVKGVSETEFMPNRFITRAEVAAYLYNMIPTTRSIPPNPGYNDVPESHPHYMAIAKLTEAKIFSKAEDFNPDMPLTRVQLSKVATLAFQLKNGQKNITFKDVYEGYWAKGYIDSLATNGYLNGYSNGNFGIYDETTRAQFVVVMSRILNDQMKQQK